MYEVYCLNLQTRKTFTKHFTSPYLCRLFVNKCKYSKVIRVISYPNCICE